MFAPLIVLAFWIGLYPKPLFDILDKPVAQIVTRVRPDYYQNKNGVRNAAAPVARESATPAAAAAEPAADASGKDYTCVRESLT